MRLFLAIVSVYSVSCQVDSQIYFPEDEVYVNPLSATPELSQNREHFTANTLHSPYQTHLEQQKSIEQLVAKGISNLTISINNFYLRSKSLNNIVFSPVSIAGALALVLLGSNGRTFDEIASAMGLVSGTDISSNSESVHESLGKLFSKLDITEQIRVAAAIFVQTNFPIRSLYKRTGERIYKNEVINVDFRHNNILAQHVINKWVTDRTNGKIRSIISGPPSEETKVIIASALYFNGAWEKQFWNGFTRKRPFYPNGRKTHSSIDVEMMSNGGHFPHYRDTTLNCDIMGFPYKGNLTTMYVIIPHGSNVERLKSFEASLAADDINRLVESTRYTQSVVLFPKMRLEASSDLRAPLQTLGIKSLFDPFESNLALLSSGVENRHQGKAKEVLRSSPSIPQTPTTDSMSRGLNDVLIFSRFGSSPNCTQIFNPNSNMSECEEIDRNTQRQVTYKKFGDKLGRRVTRQAEGTLDELRLSLNRDPHNKNVDNPGLYADEVLHKVFIDITEQGTEAAASTSVSLNRGGDINTFRADIPFLFFIWHEETKLILFWGTVYEPTPNYS